MVLLKCIVSDTWRSRWHSSVSSEVPSLIGWLTFHLSIFLIFNSESFFFPGFLHHQSLFFKFLFAVFLINLSLECIFHFLLLCLFFIQHYLLFVTALKDTTLFLKLHVHSVLSDSSTGFEVWEIVFGLHRRVNCLTQLLLLNWLLRRLLVGRLAVNIKFPVPL